MSKKIIRLTESDLKILISRVLKEQKIDYNPKKLKFGDRGDDVKELQDKLIKNGFLKLKSGKPTGYFGNLTNAALNSAQGGKTVAPIKKKIVTPNKNSKIEVSPTINPQFKNQIDFLNLSISDTTHNICKPGQTECATFVNDFLTKITSVGSAWLAYRNDSGLGPTIYSAFNSSTNPLLTKQKIDSVVKLWTEIYDNGGGKDGGPLTSKVRKLVDSIVPPLGSIPPIKLQVDDVVGLYFPGSKHHEKAFYEGGEAWFTEEKTWLGLKTDKVPGKNVAQGSLWGMNTHVGVVGAIKDGVPLIFHNVFGDVRSDPPQNLRIAWVKRK
jgi:hypothetical protein